MKYKELSHIQAINGPILVTGHTGFKGTWLTLLLESLNIEVIGLSHRQIQNLFTLGLAEPERLRKSLLILEIQNLLITLSRYINLK